MVDIVMYILVNTDLKMGKGKIAAQVAHSAIKASRKAETSEEHRENWVRWYSPSHTKVILRSTEKDMRFLSRKYFDLCVPQFDAGRTQVRPNSFTTLAFVPIRREDTPPELKELKLL